MKIKPVARMEGVRDVSYTRSIYHNFRLTFRHFFKNFIRSKEVVTFEYPEVKRNIPMRWKGRHRLKRGEDNHIKCDACMKCVQVCPSHCIEIDAQIHPVREVNYPAKFELNMLKCVFCGFCVDVCDRDAIRMDTGIISLVGKNKEDFYFSRKKILDRQSSIKSFSNKPKS
ncbi:MAG: NADH-quinone oxidoreductase subunit I [bacterium]|jgi:NADH-quinone oxidoreductase subunit I